MNYKTISRIIVALVLFIFSITDASAQVVQKIGQNSFTINTHAVLELESTSKGFLPPRMTAVKQSEISSLGLTEKGLIVYITDTSSPGLQIWDGTKWLAFVDNTALALKANTSELTAEVTRAKAEESINAAAIALNTAKTGITAAQADAITANTAKVGISSAQVDAITANTAKIGVSTVQADAITANTAKVGITTVQADAILANTAKTGITVQQASDITSNNAKVGITTVQSDAITANTAAILLKEDRVNKSTSITVVSNSDIKFPTEKAVIDYVNIKTSTISVIKQTSNYTALDSDNTILCDTSGGTFKLSLPAAIGANGKIYVIRKTDTSNIALTFSELILVDGSTFTSLNYPKTIRVQSEGSAWYVID